jgi:hypothetical protein
MTILTHSMTFLHSLIGDEEKNGKTTEYGMLVRWLQHSDNCWDK